MAEKQKPIDCRVIENDTPVIISWNTAVEALSAMEKLAKEGAYEHLLADDASFTVVAIQELRNATNKGVKK